jgi:hypothetical protein
MRRNFSSTSFFKFDSWTEKSGIYCRRITVFKDMSTKLFIKNEQYGILKCWLMKSCVLTLALIWNHPELYTACCEEVISILLKVKNDLWISWKSDLVRHIELKVLLEAYLTRSTLLWKFQPERTILSGKSFVRGTLNIIYLFLKLGLWTSWILENDQIDHLIHQWKQWCTSIGHQS